MELRAMIGAGLAAMLLVAAVLYGPALTSRAAAPPQDLPTEPVAAVDDPDVNDVIDETPEQSDLPFDSAELDTDEVEAIEAPDPAPRSASSERAPRDEDCDLR